MAAITVPTTIAGIVTNGLELGGNPNITTRATIYLAMLLQKLARDYDWPELLKSTAISLTQGDEKIDISGITDYKATRKLMLDNTDSPLAETQGGYPDLLHKINEANLQNSEGTPREYAVEPDQTDIVVYPTPQKAYTGTLLYYSIPAAATDDTEVPWFKDTMSLMFAVAEYSKLRDQEQLLTLMSQQVQSMIIRARANARDRGRDKPVQIRFDRDQFPTWTGDQS